MGDLHLQPFGSSTMFELRRVGGAPKGHPFAPLFAIREELISISFLTNNHIKYSHAIMKHMKQNQNCSLTTSWKPCYPAS